MLAALLMALSFTSAAPARQPVASLVRVVCTAPTQDDIAKAILKAFGAMALHEASKPQPGDDFGKSFARALARTGRDELIDSALQDLAPTGKLVERQAVRSLVVLALDGQLTTDRDRIINHLRRTNPGMADVVEITEFLIQFSQAVDRARNK
jgi:hypothetical protein